MPARIGTLADLCFEYFGYFFAHFFKVGICVPLKLIMSSSPYGSSAFSAARREGRQFVDAGSGALPRAVLGCFLVAAVFAKLLTSKGRIFLRKIFEKKRDFARFRPATGQSEC